MTVIFVVTAWGSKYGGINSFNADLARALAKALRARGKVICIAAEADSVDVEAAATDGVTIRVIDGNALLDKTSARSIVALVQDELTSTPNVVIWVGHDVVTGFVAMACAKLSRTRLALIHHMSYARYKSFQTGDPRKAEENRQGQKSLFRSPESILFAVGPLLKESAIELAGPGTQVYQLVPGLEVRERELKTNSLVAITFGRMDLEGDRLKLGRVSLSGFAEALNRARHARYDIEKLRSARMYLIGLEDDATYLRRVEDLTALGEKYAGQAFQVLPLPYMENKFRLGDLLAEANIAYMLSWHDGFGLAAWEAIGAQAPLVLSTNTGVYRLIAETLGGKGLGCLAGTIDIDSKSAGGLNEKDIHKVADATLNVMHQGERAERSARDLALMLKDFTWNKTAHSFIEALKNELEKNRTDVIGEPTFPLYGPVEELRRIPMQSIDFSSQQLSLLELMTFPAETHFSFDDEIDYQYIFTACFDHEEAVDGYEPYDIVLDRDEIIALAREGFLKGVTETIKDSQTEEIFISDDGVRVSHLGVRATQEIVEANLGALRILGEPTWLTLTNGQYEAALREACFEIKRAADKLLNGRIFSSHEITKLLSTLVNKGLLWPQDLPSVRSQMKRAFEIVNKQGATLGNAADRAESVLELFRLARLKAFIAYMHLVSSA